VANEQERNRDEARTLLEILQDKVIPLYYDAGPMGYSPAWLAMAKRSIASILPRFNSERMITEYVDKFYVPASRQWQRLSSGDFDGARRLASWKARVRASWHGVTVRRMDSSQRRISYGDSLHFELAVNLNGLTPDDVVVELLLGRSNVPNGATTPVQKPLVCRSHIDGGECLYSLDLTPELCGRIEYRFRIYPSMNC